MKDTAVPLFSKVLVANRGEIAVRVMQTCREMGIGAVAVYSDADATALHVRMADESYHIGPAPATNSYLDIHKIIEAARLSGAQAIHPGYGFLAENPAFAEACAAAGVVFVGPHAAAMRLLGSKQAAKTLARDAGVPVAPGYDGERQDSETLAEEARRAGFPLLIKASAGGGGKGMRVVRAPEEFAEALDGAKRESLSAFGDDTVLLERYIESPRHIEFQVLADSHGTVIHLGERECSIQRRHQKVIEESPSAALSPELRAQMGAAATTVVRAAGYTNAGTVEFMLAPTGEYYFLEVNTRLQVEHPVTENVTGLDLVREQLRIAAGLPLTVRQEDIQLRGHSIECRVYAEDPRNGFLPSTGRLLLFEPATGAGIRNDSGVETGDEITPYYDPMLAKLITCAPDRASCIERALAALRDYSVLGVTTNLPLLRAVLDSEAFRGGNFTTDFLDQRLPELLSDESSLPEEVLIAATGWVLTAQGANKQRNPWISDGWRGSGARRTLRLRRGGEEVAVSATRGADDAWSVRAPEGERRIIEFSRAGPALLLLREGARTSRAYIVETPDALDVGVDGNAAKLYKARGLEIDDLGQATSAGHIQNTLQAPMPGAVVKVGAREGDTVEAGQTLVVLEAMKMEHSITAPHAGIVRRMPYSVGDLVQAGAVLAEVEE